MRTREETLAYHRGYNTAARWPEHKPPLPPEPIAREIISAARALRDGYDWMLATLGEDDELAVKLGPLIDSFDDAMKRVSLWLRESPH